MFGGLFVGKTKRPSLQAAYRADLWRRGRQSLSDALDHVPVASTGDYQTDALSALTREKAIVCYVVSTWTEHARGRPTICFGVDIADSQLSTQVGCQPS